jgi:hypothetical protein
MTPKPLFVLISSFLLFLSTNLTAQTTADNSGIAIQGIARDSNNVAKTLTSITLIIKLYYLDGTQEVNIIPDVLADLTTDAFGVFSYVLDVGDENYVKIANHQARLRITESGDVITDEPLMQSPYAIAASNGVPTGSIMPYLGNTPPQGWVVCDGSLLPTDGSADALIALIGSNNAPDLQGMFLRGTGTNPVNGQDGPALMQTQNDTIQAHVHDAGQLMTDMEPNHDHNYDFFGLNYNRVLRNNGNGTANGTDGTDSSGTEPDLLNSRPMVAAGAHDHEIIGNTASTGDAETRPVNYGVVYIIKL